MTMPGGKRLGEMVFVIIAAAWALFPADACASEKGKTEYWLKYYREVGESTLTRRAHEVFERVHDASDRRAGAMTRLYIIDYDGRPWAQSLADGSIILTRRGLEYCYKGRRPEDGDSRLAFVLGHELAHQFNGDFWHYRFVRSTEDDEKSAYAFQDLRELAKSADLLMAKELQADQYGVIYAALAGYGIDEIVRGEEGFFLEWAESEYDLVPDDMRAVYEKRAQAIAMRVGEVADRVPLFHFGVVEYSLGHYDDALLLLARFSSYFPGREVYANLGVIYLRMAYDAMAQADPPPFALEFGMDPATRAEGLEIGRANDKGQSRYKELLESAVTSLKMAVEFDPDYVDAMDALGCAYILSGRYFDAASVLDDAAARSPNSARVANNRAVAYALLGRKVKSEDLMERAERLLVTASPKSAAAGVNLRTIRGMRGTGAAYTAPLVSEGTVNRDKEIMKGGDVSFELKPGNRISLGPDLKIIETIDTERGGSVQIVRDGKRGNYYLVKNGKVRACMAKPAPSEAFRSSPPGVHFFGHGRLGALCTTGGTCRHFQY